MIEYGYLDYEKYAINLVKYLSQTKHMSSSFIKQEMFKRGISSEIISNVLEDVEVNNIDSVVELILTKYKSKINADDGIKKVTASLMRKGFSYSDIKRAFENIENGEF